MKSLLYLPAYLLCFGIAVCWLPISCKRDIPPIPTGDLRQISFKVSGFSSSVTPLSVNQSKGLTGPYVNIEPGTEPQYVYFWSFNEMTLAPYIAVEEIGAGIEFAGKSTQAEFVSGFGLAPVDAGKALSITGARFLVVSLPLRAVESLTTFDFDIGSSSTGPKDFSLSFSIDDGANYEVLSETNQFENMGPASRNRFSFDLSGFQQFRGAEMLKLKLVFLPGDRGDSGEYNENTGTLKIDNIRLSGVYNGNPGTADPLVPDKLHYYVFAASNGALVQQRSMKIDSLGEDGLLEIKLAAGIYDVLFLAYRSDRGILLPADLTNASEFYFGQHFNDYQAVTYSVLLNDFEVGETDASAAAVLKRCYSLVEFEFTDLPADLLKVKKIVVAREHDNYLYTPFGLPADLPMSDAQSITFSGFVDTDDYRIAIHQFFGLLEGQTKAVNYELTAFGADDAVLNMQRVSENISNNVRLKLTGRLLGNSGTINGFEVSLDAEWDGTFDRPF